MVKLRHSSRAWQQNILCEQPLVTAARPVARRGSCDELPALLCEVWAGDSDDHVPRHLDIVFDSKL